MGSRSRFGASCRASASPARGSVTAAATLCSCAASSGRPSGLPRATWRLHVNDRRRCRDGACPDRVALPGLSRGRGTHGRRGSVRDQDGACPAGAPQDGRAGDLVGDNGASDADEPGAGSPTARPGARPRSARHAASCGTTARPAHRDRTRPGGGPSRGRRNGRQAVRNVPGGPVVPGRCRGARRWVPRAGYSPFHPISGLRSAPRIVPMPW